MALKRLSMAAKVEGAGGWMDGGKKREEENKNKQVTSSFLHDKLWLWKW